MSMAESLTDPQLQGASPTPLDVPPTEHRPATRVRESQRWVFGLKVAGVVLVGGALAAGLRTHFRYQAAPLMTIPVRELANTEYPEDPADRSPHHGKYRGRQLVLVQKGATHFDFVFEPQHPHIAKLTLHDVDVSLMTPSLPAWTRDHADLRRIALTDRQWNRQQVRFEATSPQVELVGGDGFEQANLVSAELAKNCLNAGLWEVQLFAREGSGKALYYQGWFTFPRGHYARLFTHNTGLPYWKHWYYLEHWVDPAGTPVPLDQLRQVRTEREVPAQFDPAEKVLAVGEQLRKRRTFLAENIVTWGDFSRPDNAVRFASFIPPGRYSVARPWGNRYAQMDGLEGAVLREIVSPATTEPLHELELVFGSKVAGQSFHFVVSGFDLAKLPQLAVQDYPKGLYMPMGIGVPPFSQSYQDLVQHPPAASPYVSVLLDASGKWIDHHSFAIDGPVMHRDAQDPNTLHVYLLSYERHSLIAHFVVKTATV